MAKKVIMWEDNLGNLHPTETAADQCNLEINKQNLLNEIKYHVLSYMNYDEFLVDMFAHDADVIINMLNNWKQFNGR